MRLRLVAVFVRVPVELHRRFKAHCAMQETTMRDRIIKLIKQDIKKGKGRGYLSIKE